MRDVQRWAAFETGYFRLVAEWSFGDVAEHDAEFLSGLSKQSPIESIAGVRDNGNSRRLKQIRSMATMQREELYQVTILYFYTIDRCIW